MEDHNCNYCLSQFAFVRMYKSMEPRIRVVKKQIGVLTLKKLHWLLSISFLTAHLCVKWKKKKLFLTCNLCAALRIRITSHGLHCSRWTLKKHLLFGRCQHNLGNDNNAWFPRVIMLVTCHIINNTKFSVDGVASKYFGIVQVDEIIIDFFWRLQNDTQFVTNGEFAQKTFW